MNSFRENYVIVNTIDSSEFTDAVEWCQHHIGERGEHPVFCNYKTNHNWAAMYLGWFEISYKMEFWFRNDEDRVEFILIFGS